MLTLNDTPTYNNALIWVMRVFTDTSTFYWSDTDITISGNSYDSTVIVKNSLTSIREEVDISKGGTIGNVPRLNFSIAKDNDYSGVSNFINDFFPNTTDYLTGARVDFGFCWSGADGTTGNTITWLYKFKTESVSWKTKKLDVVSVDYYNYVQQLPYYEVQKSFDNGVSYFPNATNDILGTTIPLVYGSYPPASYDTNTHFIEPSFILTPAINVDEGVNKFIVASHAIDIPTFNTRAYKFSNGTDNFVRLKFGTGAAEAMSNSGSYFTLNETDGGRVYGEAFVHPTGLYGFFSDNAPMYCVARAEQVYDRDPDTYYSLAPGDAMNLRFDASNLESYFDTDALISNENLHFVILAQSETGTNFLELSVFKVDDTSTNRIKLSGILNGSPFIATTKSYYNEDVVFLRDSNAPKSIFNWVVRLKNKGTANINVFQTYWKISRMVVSADKSRGWFVNQHRDNRMANYEWDRD